MARPRRVSVISDGLLDGFNMVLAKDFAKRQTYFDNKINRPGQAPLRQNDGALGGVTPEWTKRHATH
jgi:hypothetical protein